MYLHLLPSNKKNVPLMIPDPIALVKDIRTIVLQHRDDCPDQAVTTKYILRWSENQDDDLKPRAKKSSLVGSNSSSSSSRRAYTKDGSSGGSSKPFFKRSNPSATGNRRRRVRCKMCAACLGEDCQTCVYCRDMTKYGGPGRMKQTCEKVGHSKTRMLRKLSHSCPNLRLTTKSVINGLNMKSIDTFIAKN